MFLKFSVGAKLTTVACILITFCGHHSIETSLSAIIRNIIVLYSSIFISLGPTKTRLHLIIFRYFSLPIQVYIFLDGREVFEAVSEIVESDLIILEHADNLNES